MGSSGEYSMPGSERWFDRMSTAFEAICDDSGAPHTGVTVKVRRGESRKGGYTIDVTGPAPARLRLAAAAEGSA